MSIFDDQWNFFSFVFLYYLNNGKYLKITVLSVMHIRHELSKFPVCVSLRQEYGMRKMSKSWFYEYFERLFCVCGQCCFLYWRSQKNVVFYKSNLYVIKTCLRPRVVVLSNLKQVGTAITLLYDNKESKNPILHKLIHKCTYYVNADNDKLLNICINLYHIIREHYVCLLYAITTLHFEIHWILFMVLHLWEITWKYVSYQYNKHKIK